MGRITSLNQMDISQTCVTPIVLGVGEDLVELIEAYTYRDLGLLQIETDSF